MAYSSPSSILVPSPPCARGAGAGLAAALLAAELARIPGVATVPAPQVGIDGFRETSIALGYRYWVETRAYFDTRHAVNAAIYGTLIDAGVDILPQREVHLVQNG